MESGQMIFYRRWSWQDAVRSYRIEIDGKPVGRLRPRGTLEAAVAPGEHRLRARIAWTGSREIRVAVEAGTAVNIYVGPAQGLPLQKALGGDSYLVMVADAPA